MKIVARMIVSVLIVVCICYLLDIGVDDVVYLFKGKLSYENKEREENEDANRGVAVMPEYGHDIVEEDEGTYSEIMRFIMDQKEDRKLIESYRVLDKGLGEELKDRSYIRDNGLAVISMLNHNSQESKNAALEILENLSSIQNEDGSWYDYYDISAKTAVANGKEYTQSSTGDNALLLYAYSYHSIVTGDTKFKEVMRKSADFLLSRVDGETGALYDEKADSNNMRTLECNVYGYFALREYAMASMVYDYSIFKDKLLKAQRIADWVAGNCLEEGVFIQGYRGKEKIDGLSLDAQVLGSMLVKGAVMEEKYQYGLKDFESCLTKLYREISGLKGYKIDDNSKNSGYIWCEGTCRAPIAFLKLGSEESSRNVLNSIKGFHDIVSKNLMPRGIPESTNLDSAAGAFGLESVSASAWTTISFQCNSNNSVNKIFFGKEEDVFKRVKSVS